MNVGRRGADLPALDDARRVAELALMDRVPLIMIAVARRQLRETARFREQVEVAEPLAGLERLGRRRVALHQLPVLLRGAAGLVEVQGAEIAGELESAAAHVVGSVFAIVTELEQHRARFDQRRVVVPGQREVARLLELGGGALAAPAEQQGGAQRQRSRSSQHQREAVPVPDGPRNE